MIVDNFIHNFSFFMHFMILAKNHRQKPFLSKLLLLIAFFMMCLSIALPVRAQPVNLDGFVNDREYEDVILAVFTGKYRLSSGVFALQKDDRYFLPVIELADMVGFTAEYNSAQGVVSGTSYKLEDTFSINTNTGQVNTSAENFSIGLSEIRLSDEVAGEIYIEQEALQRIWSLIFEINPTVLTMAIGSTETLPFQKIIERQKAREKAELLKQRFREGTDLDISTLNFVHTPYQLFSKPTVDVQGELGFDAITSNPEYNLSLRGVQDLGYASADYSVSLREEGGAFRQPENIRLRFARENIYDGALPLNLEKVEWGDVSLANRQLISSSTSGRGVQFTTEKTNSRRQFDTIIVDGIALPGWEVELYVNGALIDFSTVDNDGEYRFEDVLLGFGTSKIKVTLYGPQGEIEEREETLVNRSNKLREGEHIFSAGVVDLNRDLIQVDKRVVNGRPEGVGGNIYGAYALSDKLTAFASFTKSQDRDASQNLRNYYTTAGLEAALPNVRAQLEVLKQHDQGYAVDARVITDIAGFKVNAQAGIYNDFTSLRAGDGTNAKVSEVDLNIRRYFPTPLGGLTSEVGFEDVRRENNRRVTSYLTRNSLNTKISRFNNTTRTNVFDGRHNRTSGRFDTSNNLGRWFLRNSLSYELSPELEAEVLQTNIRYRPNRDFSTSFTASRNFPARSTAVSAQISRDFRKFLGTVEGRWDSQNGSSILLRASTSLSPFGYDGGYVMDRNPLSQAGPVGVVAYIDKDYDNYYDVDVDEPLPDAVIDVSGRKSRYETDENGYTILPRTTRGEQAYVRISKKSIDDPYLVTGVEGYGIYPRPGVLQYVELPVKDTGAIDGTLTWSNDNTAIKGLVLQLMDKNGKIVQNSKTGSDGYFTFERISPGDYSLRADPESGFVIPFEYVRVEPDSLFQFGNDIEIVDLSRLSDTEASDDELNRQAMLNVQTMLSLVKQVKAVIKN